MDVVEGMWYFVVMRVCERVCVSWRGKSRGECGGGGGGKGKKR
jgi:hypothetical protein